MSAKKASTSSSAYTIPKPKKPETQRNRFPISQDEIKEMRASINRKLVFSFNFLELDHKAFNLGGVCTNWVNDLMLHVKGLSGITRNDFINRLSDHYRSHEHTWEDLDYCYDLSPEFLEQVECRQARISTSKGGIHGFLIGNTFYIVWLDPHHNLYPDERYGGIKILEPPQTCCKERDQELEKLQRENLELTEMLDGYTCPASI